jgi:serine acetyltransferase
MANMTASVGSAVVSNSVADDPSTGRSVKRKSLLRRLNNRVLHALCRSLPGAGSLRVVLHRLRGVQVGEGVFIGEDVYLENEYPEAVEIHDGAIVTLRCVILAHTRGPGRVIIEKNAYVGAGCIIIASANRTLTIGEGAVISAGCVVNSSVPRYTLFACERGKVVAEVTRPLPLCDEYMDFVKGLRPLRKDKQ